MLLDGEDFIIQVHRVFTRIHSGASLVASSDDMRGSAGYVAQQWLGWLDSWLDVFPQLRM
jgi:hypothetical protein